MKYFSKFFVAVLLFFAASTLTSSLLAQSTAGYYPTVEEEVIAGKRKATLYVRYYASQPYNSKRKNLLYNPEDGKSLAGDYSSKDRITRVVFDVDSNFKPNSTKYWFKDLENLEHIEGLEKVNIRLVKNMMNMFENCKNLKTVNLTGFSADSVMYTDYMFKNCSSLTSIDWTSFSSKNLYRMIEMFYGCTSLTMVDLGNIDMSNICSLQSMFYNCTALKYIICSTKANLQMQRESWFIANGTKNTFKNCTSLKGYYKSGFVNFDQNKIDYTFFKDAEQGGYISKRKTDGATITITKKLSQIKYGEDVPLLTVTRRVELNYTTVLSFDIKSFDVYPGEIGVDNKKIGTQTYTYRYKDIIGNTKSVNYSVSVKDYPYLVEEKDRGHRYTYPITMTEDSLDLKGCWLIETYASEKRVEHRLDTMSFVHKTSLDTLTLGGPKFLELRFNLGDTIVDYNYFINNIYDVLEGIELVAPTKTKYKVGEKFKAEEFFEGMQYIEKWHHGGDSIYDLGKILAGVTSMEDAAKYLKEIGRQIEVVLPSRYTAGKNPLVFKFQGFEASVDIEFEDYIDDIEVWPGPTRHDYRISTFTVDSLDLRGGKIKKIYASGDEVEYAMDTLEYTAEWSMENWDRENELQRIDISFNLGDTIFTWCFDWVYIYDEKTERNVIEKPVKTKFIFGEKLNLVEVFDGLVFEVVYFSGYRDTTDMNNLLDILAQTGMDTLSTEEILAKIEAIAQYKIGLFSTEIVGIQQVTITGEDYELSWDVEVLDYLTDIFVASQPAVRSYVLPFSASDLDLSGGVIKKIYASGEEVDMAMDTLEWTIESLGIEGVDTVLEEGSQTIRLSFELGDTTWGWLYLIDLKDVAVDFSIVSEPTTTRYKKGEYIKLKDLLDGVVLRREWASGKEEIIALGDFVKELVAKVESGEIEIKIPEDDVVPEGIDTLVLFLADTMLAEFGVAIYFKAEIEVGTYELKFVSLKGNEEGEEPLKCSCDIEVFEPTVAAEDLEVSCGVAAFEAWTRGGVLSVKAVRGGVLEVLSVNGALVRRVSVVAGGSVSLALEKGVYVLRMEGEVKKVAVE